VAGLHTECIVLLNARWHAIALECVTASLRKTFLQQRDLLSLVSAGHTWRANEVKLAFRKAHYRIRKCEDTQEIHMKEIIEPSLVVMSVGLSNNSFYSSKG